MTALVAAACAAAAIVTALHRPPAPSRLAAARPRRTRVSPGRSFDLVGRGVRRRLGLPADPRAERRLGLAAVLAVVALVVGPLVAALLAVVGGLRSRWKHLRAARRAPTDAIARDLPDVVDLLSLAVGAGLSVPAALPVVAPVAPASVSDDLRWAVDGVAGGRAADDVIVELGARWGEPGRPLVHALTDHLRYGTPVLPALERVATDARAARRRAAEVRARKLPVLLLFPLVLCTLPAFGLLTVAPLVAGTLDALQGGHLEAPASLAP